MKIKHIVLATLVCAATNISAHFAGLQEAMTAFGPEIAVLGGLYKKIVTKGNLSPLIQSPVVAYLRLHHAEISQEVPAFFACVEEVYHDEQATVARKEVNARTYDFAHDPLLMQTRSGKEIIELASYKALKAAHEASQKPTREIFMRHAPKMPVLTPILEAAWTYSDVLFFERLDVALACISWDDTLENVINDQRAKNARFDELCDQLGIGLELALDEAYAEMSLASLEPSKELVQSILACFGNSGLLKKIGTLRLVQSVRDQQFNVERMTAILQEPEIAQIAVVIEELAQIMPVVQE